MGPVSDLKHTYLWITRTSRRATCKCCDGQIHAWEFRALFVPHPDTVPDKRRWGQVWWKYYHIKCIRSAASLQMAHEISVDCVRAKGESTDVFNALCESAKQELLDVFRGEG